MSGAQRQDVAEASAKVTARDIFGLALPALGVLAATPLYLLLDTAVVGRLGGLEQAALAVGATIQSQVTTQLTFLSYGTTARSSRLFGQGRRAAAVAEGVQATWVALGVGVALALAVIAGAPLFAGWLGGNAEVAQEAAAWMRVAALGIPLTLIIMAGNGWLRGVQDTRRPLYFTLAGVIPGAILVPLLVARMGLVGSAVANLVGVSIAALLFLGALIREHRGPWRPQWSVIRKQLVLGRDLIVRSASFQVAFLSAAGVAGRFGVAALAAHQIMLQLWNFLALVLDSLAIAAQTLTGAALGKGTVRQARAVGVAITRYSVIFSCALAACFAAGAGVIPRLFSSDEAVLREVGGPWWLMIAMIVMGGVLFALDGVLLGAADAAFLRNATVVSVLCGFLPGVWLAYAFDGGLMGVWCGLLAFIGLRLVAVVWRFRSMKWAV
ncbi:MULTISPECIES: MATE family efflux transporter [unclassified Corynebacterium]|uniref:MATE family efflux transporter n=1 Tax=unclassified Corynebacterium TaxID=2624378 RepID=UPI0029CA8B62|nr:MULTISPECIES: MATE family efflux transporter [unclassified Corynebacterium]WPF65290.1 MATE family efflux transporter [Corynebacterium sp. 22KM0430]WPF67785.1 MATE family efflux transporter [Corynebacterium sp. 21KM1197]